MATKLPCRSLRLLKGRHIPHLNGMLVQDLESPMMQQVTLIQEFCWSVCEVSLYNSWWIQPERFWIMELLLVKHCILAFLSNILLGRMVQSSKTWLFQWTDVVQKWILEGVTHKKPQQNQYNFYYSCFLLTESLFYTTDSFLVVWPTGRLKVGP